MTLDDLGNIGEFVGALGVIASLVYLAIQIRQNTRAIKGASYHAVLTGALPRDVSIIENPDVARLLVDGMAGKEFSPEDYVRFHSLMQSIFRVFDSMYYQYRSGTLDAEHWETHLVAVRRWLDNLAFRDWWTAFGESFTPSFRELVAREMGAIDEVHRSSPERGDA